MADQPRAGSPEARLPVAPPSARDLLGAFGVFVGTPALVYYAWICSIHADGRLVLPDLDFLRRVEPPDLTSLAIVVAWFGFHVLCQVFVPGQWVRGAALNDGTRLSYRLNGLFTFCLTFALLGGGMLLGWLDLADLYPRIGGILTSANLLSYALAIYLYLLGRRTWPHERVSGNLFYDYFMGSALNPRNKQFDWKFFCESRPGLIGWIVLDVALAATQYELYGEVSATMALVCLFQFLYVADYFLHEEAILSTFDIRHENFGWMLAWGDLVWVPFMYSLQAAYLVHNPVDLPWWALVAITLLNLAGLSVFRSANNQKHRFRADPSSPIWGRPPTYISTAEGSKLLTSGWWGKARHVNYLGDITMGLAWCLLTGFNDPLPYFYFVYITSLLIHRERRDHATCAKKYGEQWATYCEQVKWRIIPGVF